LPAGREPGAPYDLIPMYRRVATAFKQQLTVAANFVEVFLAREGHQGPVGINYLAKIQMPTLPSLYGAMLAGVDYVLMGAGIPRDIPGVLDRFSSGLPAGLRLDVGGSSSTDVVELEFDPATCGLQSPSDLKRPAFLPIVASNSLVTVMARKANGRVDGFVIEGPTAGGHNAPPRGRKSFNDRGEPVYGPRDEVNLDRVADEGLPFWVAGGMGRPDQVERALSSGASGVQVATLFAYCQESGLSEAIKDSVVQRCQSESVDVRTDDRASPTGFPFKAVDIPESVSSPDIYDARERICDLGYLRTAVQNVDGRLAYRCPAEPVASFVAAGGAVEETVGRRCLCNSLLANIGLAQLREDGSSEPTFVTSGDDLAHLGTFLDGRTSYSAAEVIDYLLPN
ncbi:MAG: nitronate monooxygenase, partial [Rhodothermales bacterium]|nr:nitronate monooxygenase [Rhodothermales bacterium]